MKDADTLPDIMTVDEVAGYLRVSKTTVCRWCNSGKLPAFRLGRSWRVKRCDMEAHISRIMAEPDRITDDQCAIPPPTEEVKGCE
jgi:excisionase family DNA binding protein